MNRKGFTLIELVIVIVILGILAAVAVPKFVGLTKDAKISAVKGFAGSLRAAANIVHAKWLIKGENPVNVEGKDVYVDNLTGAVAPGYPLANSGSTTPGIVNAINYDNDTFTVDTTNTDNKTVFTYKNETNCSVTYTYVPNDTDNATSAPVVTIDTTGCK